MAHAAPTVSSTKETTNYAGLCHLLVDAGTQALRDTFNAMRIFNQFWQPIKQLYNRRETERLSTQRNGESYILLFHPQCLPETLISHF